MNYNMQGLGGRWVKNRGFVGSEGEGVEDTVKRRKN
jgi:hypothetical protein